MDWCLGRNSKLWEPLRRIRGVVPSAGVGPKLNHSLSRCYPYYPSRGTLSDHTPYLSGKDYQWWSFPNNLLLNFPADWPSSSTAYMLSQGDSTPGPTLERFPISTIPLNSLWKKIFQMAEWGFEPRTFRSTVRFSTTRLSPCVWFDIFFTYTQYDFYRTTPYSHMPNYRRGSLIN